MPFPIAASSPAALGQWQPRHRPHCPPPAPVAPPYPPLTIGWCVNGILVPGFALPPPPTTGGKPPRYATLNPLPSLDAAYPNPSAGHRQDPPRHPRRRLTAISPITTVVSWPPPPKLLLRPRDNKSPKPAAIGTLTLAVVILVVVSGRARARSKQGRVGVGAGAIRAGARARSERGRRGGGAWEQASH